MAVSDIYREPLKKRLRIWAFGIKEDANNKIKYRRQRYVIDKRSDRHKKDYLAIAVIAKDEGRYIKEYIDFHLMVGVDRIYFFDNESTDNTREVLKPYIDSGKVIYIFFREKRCSFPPTDLQSDTAGNTQNGLL